MMSCSAHRLGRRRLPRSVRLHGVAPTRGASRPFSVTPARHTRSPNDAFRVAVVGAGPAGFYTAYRVMNKVPGAQVDMFESLPVPYGLVRHGVAPDHPDVKNCQDKFEEIASSPNFTFIGNVSVGRPGHRADHATIDLHHLFHHYDALLLSYGASEDKKLGVPGESTLAGIYSARQFVGWYNGLTDCADLRPDLTQGDEAVVIGQGNVALDVARMLLEDVDVLRKTDITEYALATLAQSRIKRVRLVGRRGPMQAAYTIKEIRELTKLESVGFHPVDRALIPPDVKALPRASRRLMEVILGGSTTPLDSAARSWSLDNCLAPTQFIGHEDHPSQVSSTQFARTQLADPFDPESSVSTPTSSDPVVFPSHAVFRSIGYKSVPLPGFTDAGIQFDDRRGIVVNDGRGRVTRLVSNDRAGHVAHEQVPGVYCAGWVKRGPTGVIASTMADAFATGDAIAGDWLAGTSFLGEAERDGECGRRRGWEGLRHDVGNLESAVMWEHWRKIDAAERERGQSAGKEREKFPSAAEMLAVLS